MWGGVQYTYIMTEISVNFSVIIRSLKVPVNIMIWVSNKIKIIVYCSWYKYHQNAAALPMLTPKATYFLQLYLPSEYGGLLIKSVVWSVNGRYLTIIGSKLSTIGRFSTNTADFVWL